MPLFTWEHLFTPVTVPAMFQCHRLLAWAHLLAHLPGLTTTTRQPGHTCLHARHVWAMVHVRTCPHACRVPGPPSGSLATQFSVTQSHHVVA